jgi:hypothetical protein
MKVLKLASIEAYMRKKLPTLEELSENELQKIFKTKMSKEDIFDKHHTFFGDTN